MDLDPIGCFQNKKNKKKFKKQKKPKKKFKNTKKQKNKNLD